MPKDFLQGASLKKSPHDVQTKGGGVKGLLNNVKKNCTFLSCRLPILSHLHVKAGQPTCNVRLRGELQLPRIHSSVDNPA